MKEPILSREEVLELAVDAFGIDYDRLDGRFEKYAALIESALLEKLCGEPAAYINEVEFNCLKNNARAVVSPKGMKDDDETIPLYVINRTKS